MCETRYKKKILSVFILVVLLTNLHALHGLLEHVVVEYEFDEGLG